MGKFSGLIGYSIQGETAPGVWTECIEERKIIGEYIRRSFRNESNSNLNKNITLSGQVSFLADLYALKNFHHIVYCKINGVAWEVTEVSPEHPRLTLTLGGLYAE